MRLFRAFRPPSDLPDAQQSAMAGKKVFETEIHLEVAIFFPDSLGVQFSIADQFNRLRQLLPFRGLALIHPQIPVGPHRIPAIAIQMILRQLHDARRVQRHRPQILFQHRRFSGFQGLNLQVRKPRPLGRIGHRRQKLAKLLQHRFFGKFLQPNIQIRLICHPPIIPGCRTHRNRAVNCAQGSTINNGFIPLSVTANPL